ncbi:hypothetical protein K7X08_010328 [Anisodus acutangulus]|uniref:Uncharacterized protein n=1 Tax=Anisodus acutangulus TaxID=402998 RepID=A0A9Q1RUE3_9SOLA|nr:hypothetical protein K7X08_010328 [Anisodus acutangulus]
MTYGVGLVKAILGDCLNLTNQAVVPLARRHDETLELLNLDEWKEVTDANLVAITDNFPLLNDLDVSEYAITDYNPLYCEVQPKVDHNNIFRQSKVKECYELNMISSAFVLPAYFRKICSSSITSFINVYCANAKLSWFKETNNSKAAKNVDWLRWNDILIVGITEKEVANTEDSMLQNVRFQKLDGQVGSLMCGASFYGDYIGKSRHSTSRRLYYLGSVKSLTNICMRQHGIASSVFILVAIRELCQHAYLSNKVQAKVVEDHLPVLILDETDLPLLYGCKNDMDALTSHFKCLWMFATSSPEVVDILRIKLCFANDELHDHVFRFHCLLEYNSAKLIKGEGYLKRIRQMLLPCLMLAATIERIASYFLQELPDMYLDHEWVLQVF